MVTRPDRCVVSKRVETKAVAEKNGRIIIVSGRSEPVAGSLLFLNENLRKNPSMFHDSLKSETKQKRFEGKKQPYAQL